MKFNHNKHDVEQSAYDIKVLGKIISMINEQILEDLKESFQTKIKAQLREIGDTDVTIGKADFLILLFKSELSSATCSSMPLQIMERIDNTTFTNDANNRIKTNTFQKVFSKTVIDPEG